MTKKQYIAPVSERVFLETIMWNPGKGGGIVSGVIAGSGGVTTIDPTHVICAPGRTLYL